MPKLADRSTPDISEWAVKKVHKAKGVPQVEIRNGYGVVIIVSLGEGYKYGYYGKRHPWNRDIDPMLVLQGINIHLALNGALQCTFEEWDQITALIYKAKEMLENGDGVVRDST